MSWNKELQLNQLDAKLKPYQSLAVEPIPNGGWIHTLRKALGMSRRSLGERIRLSVSRVAAMEHAEVDRSITLKSLDRAAAGLGCRVVYALVPEPEIGSLHEVRHRHAFDKAVAISKYLDQQMALEDQATGQTFERESTRQLAEKLMKEWPRDFWDEL